MIELVEAIRRRGPIPFSEVVEAALYDEDEGFYATTGTAGRDGDFITSPELGPLFGAVVAGALDTWWRAMGEPDPYVVVEAAAGPGTLGRTVMAARPACSPALRYVMVERSAAQRALHAEHLRVDDASQAFAPERDPDDADEPVGDLPLGPIVVSLSELPRIGGPCIVLANELLDNLPFDLYERRAGRWLEVRAGLDDADEKLVEVLVPVADEPEALAGVAAGDGARAPLHRAAAAWVRDALALTAGGGRLVCFDYARATTAELASRPPAEWLRTYRKHGPGGAPLERLGSQDITTEVAVDQLPAPGSITAQADWLRAHGLDELVGAARATWEERAATGDLEAIAALSRVNEGTALSDPDGPGAFLVLEWAG